MRRTIRLDKPETFIYNWTFLIKITIAGIGLLIYMTFLWKSRFLSTDDFRKTIKDDKSQSSSSSRDQYYYSSSSRQTKSNPRYYTNHNHIPTQAVLMALNTMSIFFLMLTIQEWRANEIIDPIGVDSELTPIDCKVQQQIAYWILFGLCVVLLFLNLYNMSNMFYSNPTEKMWKNASDTVLGYDRLISSASTKKHENFSDHLYESSSSMAPKTGNKFYTIIGKIIKEPDWTILFRKLPNHAQFLFSYIIGIFSIILYTISICVDNIVDCPSVFKSCYKTADARYFDPCKPTDETVV